MTEPLNEFQFLAEDGVTVLSTGCLPRVSKPGELPGVPEWNGSVERCPLVRREECVTTTDMHPYERRDIFQNGYSSCSFCGTANAIEFLWSMNHGEKLTLDWLKAYQELVGGSGGAPVDSVLKYAMKRGYPLVGSEQRVFVTEAWDATTVEAAWSVIERGYPLAFGWYFPGGAHCECALQVKPSNGRIKFVLRNSHGLSFGDHGWHEIDEQDMAAGIKDFGGFAVLEAEVR